MALFASPDILRLALEPTHGGRRIMIGVVHIDDDSTTLANIREMIPLASGLDPPPLVVGEETLEHRRG